MDPKIVVPVTLRPSLVRTVFLFFGSAIFVIGGVTMVRHGQMDGYLCGGFFALGMLIFGLRLHPGATYLRLTEEDFTYCSLFRARTVRWADVQGFAPVRMGRTRLVGWSFVPGAVRLGRARNLSKAISGCEAALPDSYGMKPRELADVLNRLLDQYRQSRDI